MFNFLLNFVHFVSIVIPSNCAIQLIFLTLFIIVRCTAFRERYPFMEEAAGSIKKKFDWGSVEM